MNVLRSRCEVKSPGGERALPGLFVLCRTTSRRTDEQRSQASFSLKPELKLALALVLELELELQLEQPRVALLSSLELQLFSLLEPVSLLLSWR